MITGMIVLAMPITVIGSAFSAEYDLMKKKTAAEKRAEKAEQLEFDRLILIEEALHAGVSQEAAEAEAEAVTGGASGNAKVAPEPPRTPLMLGGGGSHGSADFRTDSARSAPSVMTVPVQGGGGASGNTAAAAAAAAAAPSSASARLGPEQARPLVDFASAERREGIAAAASAGDSAGRLVLPPLRPRQEHMSEVSIGEPALPQPPSSASSTSELMRESAAATGIDHDGGAVTNTAIFELLLELRARLEAQGREVTFLRRESSALRKELAKLTSPQ